MFVSFVVLIKSSESFSCLLLHHLIIIGIFGGIIERHAWVGVVDQIDKLVWTDDALGTYQHGVFLISHIDRAHMLVDASIWGYYRTFD